MTEAAPLARCCCGQPVFIDGQRHWVAVRCTSCTYTTARFGTRVAAVAAHEAHTQHGELERLRAWLRLGATRRETLFGRGLDAAECQAALDGKDIACCTQG